MPAAMPKSKDFLRVFRKPRKSYEHEVQKEALFLFSVLHFGQSIMTKQAYLRSAK